ncbi:hypothetical protein [Streptomyces erythrochromogenes]|uniref:hypothetical protein n=1 Tax=Streptomyces erythrochromogenes TaxID=285574 RepID=UPI003693877B
MPFEDDLGAALRRTGDGFTTDRDALVDAGEARGRRLVARRRAAVVGGSVLALALVGTAGAYAGGLLDGGGGAEAVHVASPPTPSGPGGTGGPDSGSGKGPRTGSGAVGAERMMVDLEKALAGEKGKLTAMEARGTESEGGAAVSGVYDDGKGKAALSVALSRVDPKGSRAGQVTQCGDKNLQGYDDCRTERLPDGSKLLIFKGYEYPDRRVDTKCWRAVLVTPAGFMVEASEWNAPAEKDAPVSRPNPPLDSAQLKTLVTSPVWHPALNDMPAAEPEQAPGSASGTVLKDRSAADALESLLTPVGIPIASRGGEGSYGYAVLDDGKGTSLVQLNVSKGESTSGFTGAGVTTESDGTKVRITQGPAEKGRGVVQWTVDTLRGNGLRVTVSGFNTANQSGTATRPAPAVTLEQLKAIALAPGWNRDRN